jgi:hypothetical protein
MTIFVRAMYRIVGHHPTSTSFPGLSCEDERREEKALVWVGQFCILFG